MNAAIAPELQLLQETEMPEGLPEEILKDDIETLRHEEDVLEAKFDAESKAIRKEILIRLQQGREAGYDVSTW